MADAHIDDSGAPPVTICCAVSDGASVREAAEALVARGHLVELAVGVDADTAVLTRAIARLRGRGLYVLCRSHSLDRNAVDLLREILRTHDVPFGRTLTLAVDTQRPREVEERIVSVLRRMVTGRADGRPKAWGTHTPTHEEDPDTTIRRPGGSMEAADPSSLQGLGTEPEDSDPYASTSQIEVAYEGNQIVPAPSLPLPYMGAEHTAVGPAPHGSAAASAGATLPGLGLGGAPMPGLPMAGPLSMGSASSSASGPMASASMSGPMSSASVSMPAEPIFSPGMPMSSPGMNDALTAYTPPPVSAGESSADDELTTGGRMGRALGSPAGLALMIGGLAVVVLAVIGAFVLTGDDADDAQASATPAEEPASKTAADAKRKTDAKDGAKQDASKGGAKQDDDAKDDGGATKNDDAKDDGGTTKNGDEKDDGGATKNDDAKDDGGTTKNGDAKDDGDAKGDDAKDGDAADAADAKAPETPTEAKAPPADEPSDADADADADAPATPTPGAAPSRPRWAAAADPGDPLPSRSFAPEDDPPEVVAALKSREVRALDVFLVAPERKGTLTYDQAVTYCQSLEIAGLTGWRVPAIGEINAVAAAKMLGKAIYWSLTPGDSFGDLRLVVGTKKAITIVAVPKTWDGAKIVCIRPRQP